MSSNMQPSKRLFLSFCVSALIALTLSAGTPGNPCVTGLQAAKQAAKAVNELAVKVHKTIISTTPNANIVFSPVSIALGLALLQSGSAGDTRKELQRLLGPPGTSESDSSALYPSLQRNLRLPDENAKLTVANGLFYSEHLTLKPEYVSKLGKCFEAKMENSPFSKDPEASRNQINRWVANETVQKIPELLKSGAIDGATVAVLANAVYMKAAWQEKFQRTENLPFYNNGELTKLQKVPFMVNDHEYNYAEDSTMQVVEIPYKTVLSMYIILPKQRDGIKSVESALTGEKLQSLFSSMSSKQVILKVPKFETRLPTDLQAVLEQLGVKKMFSDQADFSRMSPSGLNVSKGVHEAYIKVNENGTEAAAATAFGFAKIALPMPPPLPPVTFIADHPFIYAIVHKPVEAIVFFGKVNSVYKVDE